MTDDLIRDVGDALYRLRIAFAKHNIPCPDILEYSDQEKAYTAKRALRCSVGPTDFGISAVGIHGEASIHGFSLRFEARKVEFPGRGPEFDDGISGRIFKDDLK